MPAAARYFTSLRTYKDISQRESCTIEEETISHISIHCCMHVTLDRFEGKPSLTTLLGTIEEIDTLITTSMHSAYGIS